METNPLRARLEAHAAGRTETPRGNVLPAATCNAARPVAKALQLLVNASLRPAGDALPAPSELLPPLP